MSTPWHVPWTHDAVQAGDRVGALGFNSVDFTTIDVALGVIGAVAVPLQTSAAIAQLKPIVTETEPTVFADRAWTSCPTPSS